MNRWHFDWYLDDFFDDFLDYLGNLDDLFNDPRYDHDLLNNLLNFYTFRHLYYLLNDLFLGSRDLFDPLQIYLLWDDLLLPY